MDKIRHRDGFRAVSRIKEMPRSRGRIRVKYVKLVYDRIRN